MSATTERQSALAHEIFNLNIKNIDICLDCLRELVKVRPETSAVIKDVERAKSDYANNSLHYQSEYAQMGESVLAAHKERILNGMEMIASAYLTLVINGMDGGRDD